MPEPTFTFDDEVVSFVQGQSVGAALLAAGVRQLRVTRVNATPRGIFCGIGVCFDCLVSIDGQSPQRACVEPATPGMRVTSAGDGS